jgi:predicted deacylase
MTVTHPPTADTAAPAAALTFTLPCPDLGPWRAGNTGTEGVWQFDSGVPGRHVLITALVHGNELCGAWALLGLLQAGVRPQQGMLTLAFGNLAAFDTFDPGNHDASRCVAEDMNRQWSTERLATPLAASPSPDRQRAIALRPFVQQADWLLDLHSMHERAAPLLLTGLHPRNQALAKALGNPAHVVVDAGHQDGVRMRDFGRFGLPDNQAPDTRSLLIECGFHGDLSSRDVAHDLCLRFLVAAGTLGADEADRQLPGWRMTDAPTQTALTVTGAAVARSERFCFVAPYQGLEVFANAGTVIGHHDGPGLGNPVVTPHDHCVLVMPSVRQARAGVTVVRFAKATALG